MGRPLPEAWRSPTLEAVLDALVPWDLPGLIGAGAHARVAAVARHLEGALGGYLYLERWLAAEPGRVDLVLRVDHARSRLLAGCPAPERGRPGARAWSAIQSFRRAWERPDAELGAGVLALWLEFDLPEASPEPAGEDELPPPRVFLDFSRAVYAQRALDPRLALAGGALRALLGEEAAGRLEGPLRRCLVALPEGAGLIYVGCKPESPSAAMRVCLLGICDDELPRYLRAVGWPGDIERLVATTLRPLAAARTSAGRSVAILHLDFDPQLLPRLGLEYAFERRSQRAGWIGEAGFLEALVLRGLCDPAAVPGLLSWPALSLAQLPHEIWFSRVTRRVGHVKVVHQEGRPPVAKAYLCVHQDLLPGHPAPATVYASRGFEPSARPSAIE